MHGGFAEWSPAVTGPTRTGELVLCISSVDIHRGPRIFPDARPVLGLLVAECLHAVEWSHGAFGE